MFEIEDDFEVDEEFLKDVFNAENSARKCLASVARPAEGNHTGQPSLVQFSPPFQATPKRSFLRAWKSNNTSLNTHSVISSDSPRFEDGFRADDRLWSAKKVRTRKFPGPAGLLPERQGNNSLVANDEFLSDLESESTDKTPFKEEEVLSQKSSAALNGGAWGRVVGDLGAELVNRINVRSVRSRGKHSRSIKVPCLALAIISVDASSPDPVLTLADSTGEMVGGLHREVWERYGGELLGGTTVLVLRSVGLISAGHTSKRHYLNITANNIAAIYTNHNCEEVKVINVRPVLRSDVSRLVEEWEGGAANKRPRLSETQPAPPTSTPNQSQAIVETLLHGIDTESLFEEF